ncbi:MAG: hypothetical protein ACI8UO_001774 [Verrucomicrobiales bacterium]|jgi:hypothetical protein
MIASRILALVLALGLGSATAEDLTTLAGRTYLEARVTKVFPDGVIIFHSKGVAKVGYTNLPNDWQERFEFDPEKAKAFAEIEAKRKTAFEAWKRTAIAREQETELDRQLEAKKAAETYNPITAEQVKQIWLLELAKPGSPLAKDPKAEAAARRSQASSIQVGRYDDFAEKLAMEQNIRRLQDRGMTQLAENYFQQLLELERQFELRKLGSNPVKAPPRDLLFLIPRS